MNHTLYGLTKSPEESEMVIVSVPWNANASEPTETHLMTQNLLEVSSLIDFYHPDFQGLVEYGIGFVESKPEVSSLNTLAKGLASQLQHLSETDQLIEKKEEVEDLKERLDGLNAKLINHLYGETKQWVDQGKLVGVLGGDHSISLGYINMIADQCDQFGVLQIDAHCDLRASYLENTFSHASIMYHVSQLPSVSRLVQVGCRDVSQEEVDYIKQSKGKIKTFFYDEICDHLYQGKSWQAMCKKIINALPSRIYISFDIDGLTPDLCPHTGTPVPGGLSFGQVEYLLKMIYQSGKQIIGFDLVEVGQDADHQWDEKVASRVLYLLCGYFSATNYDKK